MKMKEKKNMSTFNLKKNAAFKQPEINLDEHITMRLKEQHVDAPNQITERQLDENRFEVKEVILEKQLEKVRTGSADVVTERNLNESKGKFGDLRNSKASEGDINKIEEKRLAGERTEKEKYEAASATPKALKWWEHLKKAGSSKVIKTAKPYGEFRNVSSPEEHVSTFGDLGELEGEELETGLAPDVDKGNEFIGTPGQADEVSIEEEQEILPASMKLLKFKEVPEFDSLYFVLGFEPEAFHDKNDKQLKEHAMEQVINLRPELKGKISIDDFAEPEIMNGKGSIALRLIGKQYFDNSVGADDSELFTDEKVETIDDGGTPVTVGLISLSEGGIALARDEDTREELAIALEKYLIGKHPEMAAKIGSEGIGNYLDFSGAEEGTIKFAIGGDGASVEEIEDESDKTEEEKEIEDITGEREEVDETTEEPSFPVVEQPEQPEQPSLAIPARAASIKSAKSAKSAEDFPIVVAEFGAKKN